VAREGGGGGSGGRREAFSCLVAVDVPTVVLRPPGGRVAAPTEVACAASRVELRVVRDDLCRVLAI